MDEATLADILRQAVSRLSPDDRDDCRQDILEKWLKYPPRSPAGAWLFANHAIALHFRRKKYNQRTAAQHEAVYWGRILKLRDAAARRYPASGQAERDRRKRAVKKLWFARYSGTEKFKKHRRDYMVKYRKRLK